LLSDIAISASGFVFEPRTGATYTANPVGVFILDGLRDGLDLDALLERIRQRCVSVPAIGVREDILDFISVLRQVGLVPPNFEL
jgi:hypothetical protein